MDETVITTAEALGMSVSANNNMMYTVYNSEHTEGVTVFYDDASCQYVIKHFFHLNDGRTATFCDKVTDNVDDVIRTMQDYYREFVRAQEKARDMLPLVNYTSKTMDELIHRWQKSMHMSDEVEETRNDIVKSMEQVRKASNELFMKVVGM